MRFHSRDGASPFAFRREVRVGDVGEAATSVRVGGERFESAVVATDRAGIYLVNVEEKGEAKDEAGDEAKDEAGDEAKGEDGASFGVAEKIGDYHFGPVTGAAALADGGVATCGADGTLRGWDLATGACAWRCTRGRRTAGVFSLWVPRRGLRPIRDGVRTRRRSCVPVDGRRAEAAAPRQAHRRRPGRPRHVPVRDPPRRRRGREGRVLVRRDG